MSLQAGALTTLEEIKAFMVVEHDGDDTLLKGLHLAAERRLETFANRPITASAITDYFDGGRGRIFLPRYPISSTADLTVVDTHGRVAEDNNETLDVAYYRVWHQKGTVQFATANGQPRRWYPGVRRWKLTWTGGLDQLTDWGVRHKPVLAQSIQLLVLDWYDKGAQALAAGTKDAIKPDKAPLPPVVEAIWESYRPVGI